MAKNTSNKNEQPVEARRTGNEHPLDALRRFQKEAEEQIATLTKHRQEVVDRIEADTRELAEIDDALRRFGRLEDKPRKPRQPRKKRGEDSPPADDVKITEEESDGGVQIDVDELGAVEPSDGDEQAAQ